MAEPESITPNNRALTPCPLCGAALEPNGLACTRCDWVPGYGQQQRVLRQRNPRDIAAAIFSVIPGAGHFFKGYRTAGLVLALVVLPALLLLASAMNLFAGWLLPLLFWPAVMIDAYFRRDRKARLPANAPAL